MGLALYIHIPFCQRKCNYCDFPSYPAAAYNVDAYLQALELEMCRYKPETQDLAVSTLFIGGGTPSILTESQLTTLFQGISKNFRLAEDAEVTMEANPGSVDFSKLKLLRQLGVNRLSLGVQSLDPKLLKRLGRIHTPVQAVEAYELAREAGFSNINLDLMNGLPGQAVSTWEYTLKTAVNLKPEHISVYGLSVEEGTLFGDEWAAGILSLPEEELCVQMTAFTHELLKSCGYHHYEISNYAMPGKECRHNQIYWHNLPYLGFGAGAASYWQRERRTNTADVDVYIEQVTKGLSPVTEREQQDLAQDMAETMFLGLRMLKGVERQGFARRFGREIDSVYGQQIKDLVRRGLLVDEGGFLHLTSKGIFLANEVFCEFLP